MLKDFVMNGLIDMEMFLTHSNLPFADALLEDLRNKREQLAQGQITPQQAVSGISQNFNQQAQQTGVDMNNMNQVVNMMNPRRAA
jgi:propanediol dehydratase small subunit